MKKTSIYFHLFAEMAQEEMEIDLQPVAGYSVENLGTLPTEPSIHAAPALGEGGGSVTVPPADDAVVTPNADATREAAAEPDLQSGPVSALNGLQRLQGAFDLRSLPQAMQQPRMRRARRQQRIGVSQRTISAR